MTLSGKVKIKYVGSKAKISNDISKIINEMIVKENIKLYIEPFVGGSNMIDHIQCTNKYGYDNNEYLIEFWKEIQNGWNPLDDVVMTKDFYTKVKNNKKQLFKTYRGIVRIMCNL